MKLTDVLVGVGAEQQSGSRASLDVTGVANDSRKVKPGDLFVAVPGAKTDGANFVGEAKSRGAVAIVAQRPVTFDGGPAFTVSNVRQALALIAANFYRKPANELMLLGVTGTNGKTTTTWLLEAICAAGGAATGRIGTIDTRFAGRTLPATHTTPDALALHALFREMVDAGTDTVIMEVSSHALDQDRVHGLTFRAAGFTNLSRDHLDYHADMEAYFQSKRKLFSENLSPGGVAVVNGDDTYAARLYNEVRASKRMAWKFSRTGGEISAAGVEYSLAGIKATLKTPAGDIAIQSSLVGPHNLENILAAAGMALGAGFSRQDVKDGLSRVPRVPGRMERIEEAGKVALVDYAHTDDALKRSLEAARTLARGRVVVVFGCGGDRDKGKRPLMGQIAAESADLVVVTSDNPRTEDPDEIIGQITAGVEKSGLRRMSAGKAKSGERGYLVDADRKAAIELAASLLKEGDVLLVAGKGHEAVQIIGTESNPFDDVAEARAALARVAS